MPFKMIEVPSKTQHKQLGVYNSRSNRAGWSCNEDGLANIWRKQERKYYPTVELLKVLLCILEIFHYYDLHSMHRYFWFYLYL